MLAAPVPHLRHGRSRPLTAASAAILGTLGPQDRLLTVNLARRNAGVKVFLPGGAAFRNVERCLVRAAVVAGEPGLRFERLAVSWVQGQADARTPYRVYLKPRGAVRLGALHGRAIRRLLTGEGWEPLRMVDARVAGAAGKVTFAGGLGDLEPAGEAACPVEVGVRALAHLGFVWQAPGGVATGFVEARVTGPREVSVTLSETPPHLEKSLLALGFPDGITMPEGFVSGDPATGQGGATGLRTRGLSASPSGLGPAAANCAVLVANRVNASGFALRRGAESLSDGHLPRTRVIRRRDLHVRLSGN